MTDKQDDYGLSRRDFLRASGLAAGSLMIPGLPLDDDSLPRWAGAPPKVALAQVTTYERAAIREQVRGQIEALGGLGDVVRPGDKVAIKLNLTGGTSWEGQISVPAVESMVTHPEVVRALAEAVLDAGAGKLYIVESIWDLASYSTWGYSAIAKDLGATLVNLNTYRPGDAFITRKVEGGGLVYNEFTLNPVLDEIDVFMSAAKMKCHLLAGITLSMKNLIGIVPLPLYQINRSDPRTALHGPGNAAQVRLPSVIVDLNRARPIHFSLIDGVKTSEGGEGPWIAGWNPIEPGILVAGKNPVATDAVGAAAMGFDPATSGFAADPFLYCLNHLQLASKMGLGPYHLDEIEIVGAALDDVRYPFKPCQSTAEEKQTRRLSHPLPYGMIY